jgi:lysophospholipase L1-like esterase
VLVAADVVVHQTKYAVNIWGYRGPIVGKKQPHEWRLAVLGESTAFGYGVRWDEAFPAYLQDALNRDRGDTRQRVTVLNLAYNNEGAYSYKFTLQDYDYLQEDAVLIYSGYNDLGGANTSVFRHASPVFRMTGYLPLLPVLLHEKAFQLKNRWGRIDPSSGKTTFEPDIAQRATIAALEKASEISRSLEAQLGQPAPAVHADTKDATARQGAGCGERWAHYCGGMYEAVTLALGRGQDVFVVTQPYYNDYQRAQQRLLHAFLAARLGRDSHLLLVNLGDAIDLKDPELCYDGLHLTPAGNHRVAEALAPYVRPLIP